ncbi:MAG: rRNA maturation RNase YbeY [Ignavibacteria bacterium]|nr:rRNA maturation RNase YbeY [Ignavibacteria bacterium]
MADTSVKFIFGKKISDEITAVTKFKKNTIKLINDVFSLENGMCHNLNLLFCGDDTIIEYNKKYLNHDYETDVITFRYEDETIDSDMIISIDTVKRNAEKYGTDFTCELYRVIIHGVLHLCGYDDKEKSEKIKMRKKENKYLKLIK